jgi:hypothetical protein
LATNSVAGFLGVSVSLLSQTPQDCFVISVVDETTGRGVPLVELKTVGNVTYYTDGNGLVAFYEPGLMDRRVYFGIKPMATNIRRTALVIAAGLSTSGPAAAA